ncbi:MAG: preprotein translocase subunit SecE [bacterium]
MNIVNKAIGFVKEVKTELTKVSWSTRQELVGSTAAVLVVTSIATIFVFVIDILLSKGLSILFR